MTSTGTAIDWAHAAGSAHDGFALDIDAVGQRIFHRDANHTPAGPFDPVGGVAAPAVVDADDRGALLLHPRNQTLFHRGVMFQRTVTVDMVLTDIEQDADGGIERGRQIDLVGRHLDHALRAEAPTPEDVAAVVLNALTL